MDEGFGTWLVNTDAWMKVGVWLHNYSDLDEWVENWIAKCPSMDKNVGISAAKKSFIDEGVSI